MLQLCNLSFFTPLSQILVNTNVSSKISNPWEPVKGSFTPGQVPPLPLLGAHKGSSRENDGRVPGSTTRGLLSPPPPYCTRGPPRSTSADIYLHTYVSTDSSCTTEGTVFEIVQGQTALKLTHGLRTQTEHLQQGWNGRVTVCEDDVRGPFGH